VTLCVILSMLALVWQMRSMEARLSSIIASSSPPPPADNLPLLRQILALLQITRDREPGPVSRDASGNEPKTGSEPSTDHVNNIESAEELSKGDLMTEERLAAASDTMQRKRSSKQTAAVKVRPQSDTGAAELTAIWNDAHDATRNDQEFCQLVSSGLSGKYDFRSESGVIVVTPRGAEFAWVVPAMRPIFHRPTLREFFEVRSESRGTVTLIRPAMMPKDIDINGYTAGQIRRGIIER
jgi:hypothetical protein